MEVYGSQALQHKKKNNNPGRKICLHIDRVVSSTCLEDKAIQICLQNGGVNTVFLAEISTVLPFMNMESSVSM